MNSDQRSGAAYSTNLNYLAWILAAVLLSLVACSRSPSYRKEQGYYREDSEYASRDGSALNKAEKFGQPRKRVVILPFYNTTPLGGAELGEFAGQELGRALRNTGKAIVPEDLRIADQSSDFYSGDKVHLGALIREGKKLGVSLIGIGRIQKITYRTKDDEVGLFRQKKAIAAVSLELRIFDVVNAKEVVLLKKTADSTESKMNLFSEENPDPKAQRVELVRLAIREGSVVLSKDTARMLDKLNWEGRIAKVNGNQIYINAGRASGLNIGDLLKVMTEGEAVYDPLTGNFMGKTQGQVKGTIEITNYFGRDGSVTAIHSGGNFQEKDIVQLY